jgi:hypothetical protein
MTITATDAIQAADHRSELRRLAEKDWTVHQLLVLLDTGRIPADKWPDFALLILAKHNSYLQAELTHHRMTHVNPLIIPLEEFNKATKGKTDVA